MSQNDDLLAAVTSVSNKLGTLSTDVDAIDANVDKAIAILQGSSATDNPQVAEAITALNAVGTQLDGLSAKLETESTSLTGAEEPAPTA